MAQPAWSNQPAQPVHPTGVTPIIGDPTLGDAILDCVIHRAHRIELKGGSLRKRHALAAAEALTTDKEEMRTVQSSVAAT
jgi:hypothetical protein